MKSSIEMKVKQMEASEAIVWLDDQIASLKFIIREMGDVPADTLKPSRELLAEYKRLRENARLRLKYHTDAEYKENKKAGQRRRNNTPERIEYMWMRNAQRYCCEDIANIEGFEQALADKSEIYDIHHRLQTHRYSDRTRTAWIRRDEDVSEEALQGAGLYYNRPASELIFLPHSAHMRLHWENKRKGGAR